MTGDTEDNYFKEWEAILSGKGPDNLAAVLEKGWEDILKRDFHEIAIFSKVDFDDDLGFFNLRFFNEPFVVDVYNKKIYQNRPDAPPTTVPEVSSFLATLIVHYLCSVKDIDVEGSLISFRELPGGGDIYYPAFQKNAIQPIIQRFGENPVELIPAARPLGGKPIRRGDAAVELPVFPKIPVSVIVWSGDEEVSANANILFDITAKEQIHIEDLAVIGGVVAGKLCR